MKTLPLLIVTFALSIQTQTFGQRHMYFIEGPKFDITASGFNPAALSATKTTPATPRDPLRLIDGTIWKVSGTEVTNGWAVFRGKVLEVQKTGIRLKGFFTGSPDEDENGVDFFVENFPYEVAEGEIVGFDEKTWTYFYAKQAGVYTYTTVTGGSRTIRKLNYGEIYIPPAPMPLTPEQIAERQALVEKRKKEAALKTIKWLQDQADAGDVYSEFRLGERYLKGEGVDKDEAKAREFLQKAAAQGNKNASELLQKLASN